MEKIIIVGLGEIADMATDYFTNDSEYEICAYAAEKDYIDAKLSERVMNEYPVVDVERLPELYPASEYKIFVAMGYGKLNHDRAAMYNRIKSMGYSFVSYISSQAFVGSNVSIGDNCFILEDNVIQRNVHIGSDVVLWSGNHIGHRTIIDDHVFLSSHVAVSGLCKIGKYSFLGINSCIGDNVTIEDNCFIGGGVALMHDAKANEIYRVQNAKADRLNASIVFDLINEKV